MSYDCFIKTAKVRHNYEKGGPPHREMARMILQIVHFFTTQRYDLSVRCVHLLEFTTEYRFPKLVVFLLSSLKYAVKPLRSYCVVHLFVDRQEMINDHWFIIYAMHAYLAGNLSPYHSWIVLPFFHPLDNLKALAAKKNCAEVKQSLRKFWQQLLCSPF